VCPQLGQSYIQLENKKKERENSMAVGQHVELEEKNILNWCSIQNG